MGDVVEFPTQDAKVKRLEDTLTGWIAGLESTYDELDALHESLNNMEKEASRQEKDYDEVIKEYIDEVGVENVPALWLTYSRSCVMKATAEGEYEMIWVGTDLDDE